MSECLGLGQTRGGFAQGDWDSLVGRSRVEVRSQTIIAKRTLVRAMINADSLKTNRQAMEDLMRLLVEELDSSAAGESCSRHTTVTASQSKIFFIQVSTLFVSKFAGPVSDSVMIETKH